jgi:protein-tyrosine phosphatase
LVKRENTERSWCEYQYSEQTKTVLTEMQKVYDEIGEIRQKKKEIFK